MFSLFNSGTPFWMIALILIGALIAAILVAAAGRVHAIKGPADAEIRSLLAFLAVNKDPADEQQAKDRISDLRAHIKKGFKDSPSYYSLPVGAAGLLFIFTLCILTSATPSQGIALCVVLSLLWMVVCTDIASCDVLDVDVFLIALVGGWVTMLLPQARWTVPHIGVLGFLVVATLILVVSLYFRMKRHILGHAEQMKLGDGDSILLFALAMFFGMDVILIVFMAGLVFVVSHGVSIFRGTHQGGAPFVPAIFLGTVLTVLLPRPQWLDLNRAAFDLIQIMQ